VNRPPRNRIAVTYPPELPITAMRDEIAEAIRRHPVVVVCGETGSGKSTQLPKICLDLGRGLERMIGHTQPRRIAARSVAARLAEELGSTVGEAVGFKVRFTDATSQSTYVKLMTDGILLAETQGDPLFQQYDTIIVDEAHERSLNIDFLLGYLQRLLPRRPDLRVIITSATIDAERFSQHFATEAGPAPVVMVSGRTYPVEIRYQPPGDAEDDDEPDRIRAVLDAIDELLSHDYWGDILVFLATEREILDVSKALRGRLSQSRFDCEVLPLYARLSNQEQNRVFEPHSKRRIVLATNVAESSLTVPGIRYVVDTGVARISRYAPRSKIQRLPIEPISQASANQRAGRCGRLGPGVCIRLYAEDDYLGRDRFTQPEIRRSNLAAVILQAEALRLGSIEQFPFIDPPQLPLIRDGYNTLFELGAVDDQHELTPLGRQLSRLPVDPRIGRMLLAAVDEGCLRETLIIAAALEVQDPRERPVDKQQQADEAHARFAHPDSDFLTYLNLWNFHNRLKEELSKNQLRRACHQNFLSPTRLREWHDVHRQLQQLVDDLLRHSSVRGRLPRSAPGNSSQPAPESNRRTANPVDAAAERELNASAQTHPSGSPQYAAIHRSLLAGLLSNVALKTDTGEYRGSDNLKLWLWPGSAVCTKKPQWIVAGELVETTRRFARTVARVQPEWIEPLAQHLVHRTYSDPQWNPRSLSVIAFEKVSLFGLPIVARRQVGYGAIDPEFSRELFIRHALVGGELRNKPPFFENNQRLRGECERMMAKSRRSDLVVDEYAVFGFYNRRLPGDVYDEPRLNRWRKEAEKANPRVLFMELADITSAAETPRLDEYPDQLKLDKFAAPLEYRFEPGAKEDGVTLVIPKAGLPGLSPERLGWLVPGLLRHKVEALIRGLPKSLRRNLIPAPDTAAKVVAELRFGEGEFLTVVAKILTRLGGEPISADDLKGAEIPQHFQMNVRVVDDHGKTLDADRDLGELRERLGISRQSAPSKQEAPQWHRDGITRWDFGRLPESIELKRGGVLLPAFPALVDQGNSVALRLFDTRETAESESRKGVRRLAAIYEHRALASHVDWFPELKQIAVLLAKHYSTTDFRAALSLLIAERAFVADHALPRSEDDFQVLLKTGRSQVDAAVQEVAQVIPPLARQYHAARLALESPARIPPHAVEDLRAQMAGLFQPNFLLAVPWTWLRNYPRYLTAINERLRKISQGGGPRDRQLQTELQPLLTRWRERSESHLKRNVVDPELTTYRWWLEEYRVSVFAQQLGTSIPVSLKRLDQQWQKVAK
jgi:ATP-dependent helicase HrpA